MLPQHKFSHKGRHPAERRAKCAGQVLPALLEDALGVTQGLEALDAVLTSMLEGLEN